MVYRTTLSWSWQSHFHLQGYLAFFESFYTSPDLAAALKEHGIGTTGTLKTTRQGLPNKVKTLAQALNRSDIRRGTGYYIRERDSSDVYVCWQGNKCIRVLSNSYPGNDAGTATRRTKDRAGRYSQIYVPLLAAIKYYNQFMGGVDTSDQLIGYIILSDKGRDIGRHYSTIFLRSARPMPLYYTSGYWWNQSSHRKQVQRWSHSCDYQGIQHVKCTTEHKWVQSLLWNQGLWW